MDSGKTISVIVKETLDNVDKEENPLHVLSKNLFLEMKSRSISYDKTNIIVVNENDDIDRVAKIATLMPSTTTITFETEKATDIGLVYDDFHHWNSGEVCAQERGFCHIPRFCEKNWVYEIAPLLESGLLQYYPNMFTETRFIYLYTFPLDGKYKDNDIDNQFLINTDTCTITNNDKEYTELAQKALEIEIPYIHDVSLKNYSEVAIYNKETLNNFKLFFNKELRKIDFSKIGEKAEFELELKNKLFQIGQKSQKELLKFVNKMVIGTLTTIVASLFIFQEIQELLKVIYGISGGGGIFLLASAAMDYIIQKIDFEGQNCYFLWLFRK